MKSIGDFTFRDCSGLRSVIIGNSINTIGKYCFSQCPELTDVYCYAKDVPYTANNVFEGSYIKFATLHVPNASTGLYNQSMPWKDFGSIVALQDGDPNPTGIELATCERHHTDNYYNLSGQQVTKPQKGIFITNGKKVIVK